MQVYDVFLFSRISTLLEVLDFPISPPYASKVGFFPSLLQFLIFHISVSMIYEYLNKFFYEFSSYLIYYDK